MKNNNFYQNAKAYDIAFNDREFDTECDFLEWCLKNHAKVKKTKLAKKRFLELGSGPSRHAIEMARRGWNAAALDLSKPMLDYASDLAETEGVKIKTINADMTNFKLDKKVILSATLMESISHLITNEQILSHFKSVADNTVPGGIYVIEASHPMFFFPDKEANKWTTEENGYLVEVTFGEPNDKYNSVTQQWEMTNKIKFYKNDKLIYSDETKNKLRWYLAEELKALIELSGVFDKYWFYGSLYFTPPKPLDESEDSDAMIIVLRVK